MVGRPEGTLIGLDRRGRVVCEAVGAADPGAHPFMGPGRGRQTLDKPHLLLLGESEKRDVCDRDEGRVVGVAGRYHHPSFEVGHWRGASGWRLSFPDDLFETVDGGRLRGIVTTYRPHHATCI